MIDHPIDFIDKFSNAHDEQCISKIAELLSEPDVRLLDGQPTREIVKDLLPTLKVRLKNTEITGRRVYGLANLIKTLSRMEKLDVIVGYGFISSRMGGSLYMTVDSDQGLGVSIVDRY
jgi:hypothetical protein